MKKGRKIKNTKSYKKHEKKIHGGKQRNPDS